jgi:hypothetical protein
LIVHRAFAFFYSELRGPGACWLELSCKKRNAEK